MLLAMALPQFGFSFRHALIAPSERPHTYATGKNATSNEPASNFVSDYSNDRALGIHDSVAFAAT